jgi:hypothetical protein
VLNGSLAWTEGIARHPLVVGVPVAIELGASWRRSVSGRRLMIYWPEMVLWLPTVSYSSQVAVILGIYRRYRYRSAALQNVAGSPK